MYIFVGVNLRGGTEKMTGGGGGGGGILGQILADVICESSLNHKLYLYVHG